jgi:spore germination protein KA
MQGSVAILFDGSPFVTVGPAYFITMFQITDDYYSRPLIATLTRILRYASFLLVILVPGLYVAISTYHQEMIPTVLLITIINQRSSNPFPTYIETLVILVLFEIIREAALRKPNVVGDSMTIVGSLIIGQTIVEAGLVSYMVIIIVSITSIAGFILSSSRLNNATRILTFIFLFLGAAFGLYGITIGFIMLILHLASLTTLDQPYLAAMAPFNLHDQEDQFLRLPFSWMKYRPKIFKTGNRTRHNMKNPVRKEE